MKRRIALRALLAGAVFAGASAAAPSERVARGAATFRERCVQCHGAQGAGDGPLAGRFATRPSNLVESTRSDEYKAQIITLGGAALGRSAVMPEWGLELGGGEIADLVEYLRSIAVAPAGAASRG
jgi:cytochrome c oxidase cbb3-type subunit III